MPTDQPHWTHTPPEAQELLAPYRSQIDALDEQIIALLGARFAVVRQVAALKAEHGIHPVLKDRLGEVRDRARALAVRAGFDPGVAEQIYRTLLEASCRLEEEFFESGEARSS